MVWQALTAWPLLLGALALGHGAEALHLTCDSWSIIGSGYIVSGYGRLATQHGIAGSSATMEVTIQQDGAVWQPEGDFVAHVHNEACSSNDGGGHWNADANGPADITNQMWMPFPISDDPLLSSETTTLGTWYIEVENPDVVLDDGAVSIVIHEPTGGRIACCDLAAPPALDLSCSDWTAIDQTLMVAGPVEISTEGGTAGTDVYGRLVILNSADLLVFEPGAAFTAHVHAEPCSSNNGGGHWQVANGGPADETNQVWLPFSGDADGSVFEATRTNPDVTVANGALSFVVHRPLPGAERIACCDLTTTGSQDDLADEDSASEGGAEGEDGEGGNNGATSMAFGLLAVAMPALIMLSLV